MSVANAKFVVFRRLTNKYELYCMNGRQQVIILLFRQAKALKKLHQLLQL